ncbi:hypothetical protein Hamer_G004477 [Homarus americanus]|uniref:Uncharacterized protein n=1 Tax=Homarus americanus TaxID=6706 RepID=A0A8J5JVZ8_HOMAM|nr:hypothetical protein Hamer_G004477 [Homarus americanus]
MGSVFMVVSPRAPTRPGNSSTTVQPHRSSMFAAPLPQGTTPLPRHASLPSQPVDSSPSIPIYYPDKPTSPAQTPPTLTFRRRQDLPAAAIKYMADDAEYYSADEDPN